MNGPVRAVHSGSASSSKTALSTMERMSSAVIDTQYFLPNDLADLFGYPSGSFSRIRYGDALYFTGCDVYDQDPDYDPFAYTFFITVHNGYIYWYCWCR